MPTQLRSELDALADAGSSIEVAQVALRAAGSVLGGSGVVFGFDGSSPSLLASDGVPTGLARAALLRGSLDALLRPGELVVVEDARAEDALGALGRHAAVAVASPLTAGGDAVGLLITLLDEVPTQESLTAWRSFLPVAGLALAHVAIRARADVSARRIGSIVTTVPDPLVVVGRDGRFQAINPAAAEVLGLNPSFDVGVAAAERLRSPQLVELLATPDGGSEDVEVTGSEPRVLRARVVPIRRQDGTEDGRVLSLEDVTARREAERVKADLVAVIGHELRTPLTMIRGYSSTLSKRADDLKPEARQRALDALHDQTGRLQRLIEDLLLVSGVERERPALHSVEADVREVVSRAAGRAMDDHPSHRLELELPAGPVVMPVDETKVEQVLRHLVENACKFSDAGTAVTVAVRSEAHDGCRVEVRDEGEGIYSGDQATLFERFRQVDGSSTRQRGGTGVGLYICRMLVEAHGGRIGVRSALGHGSTFWFVLPARPPEDDQPS